MTNIPPIQAKLMKLEYRLQQLIEGKLAKFFLPKNSQQNLAAKLIYALQNGIKVQPDGEVVAPNLFTIVINPQNQELEAQSKMLLKDLGAMILRAGKEAEMKFLTPPSIEIITDQDIPAQQVHINAQVALESLTTTSNLVIEAGDEGASIPENAFVIVNGTQTYPLEKSVINIGRRPDNHIVIDDGRVSRIHVQLRAINARYVLFDLNSTGGTTVNGKPVAQCVLAAGDVISLAGVPLVYGQDAPELGATQKYSPEL